LLPVAEGQEGITKTAHCLLLLRNPGNQLPGLPTFTKNIFEKAISPMPAMLNAVQLESLEEPQGNPWKIDSQAVIIAVSAGWVFSPGVYRNEAV
jgi:hypothetical protein